jgi:uncharacterized protein
VPQRDSAPAGAPCWVELFTSDTDKSRAFYEGLFGWTAEEAGEEYGGYINFSRGGSRIAGCMKNDGQSGMPDLWSVYLASSDAKATVDAAAANGGEVMVAAMDVMDLGVMAFVTDPSGAAIGIWQPGSHGGFTVLDEPGAPSWFELHTRDYDAAVPFYRKVFGWDAHTMSDTPEFRYTTLGEGETALAGIMDSTNFLPEGVPAHWATYFGVEDTDAAVAKVEKLGGSIVVPGHDTPYGRLAQVTDPTGAAFRLRGRG